MRKPKYIYLGDGAFLPGVPAQDLDTAAFDALSEGAQEAVRESDLYKPAEAATSGRKRSSASSAGA